MSLEQQDNTPNEGAITPSTASRVKPAPVENAFPTPPRREISRASESQQSGRQSPATSRLFGRDKSSPGPKEHKSVEALRAIMSRGGYSSGRSSVAEFDKPTRKEISQRKSQLFDQAFAVRESYYSAKERVTRDSVIVVELKLNCNVRSAIEARKWLTKRIARTREIVSQRLSNGSFRDILQAMPEYRDISRHGSPNHGGHVSRPSISDDRNSPGSRNRMHEESANDQDGARISF